MNINGDELVALLGHASVNSPLDDFLLRHGIKVRPKGNSGSYLLSEGLLGIGFEYRESHDFDAISLLAAPSRGKFNLISVSFNFDSGKRRQPFGGELPYGLNPLMAPADVAGIMGSPKNETEGSETEGALSMHAIIDRLVTVAYVVGDQGIAWVRVNVPTVHHRKFGYFE